MNLLDQANEHFNLGTACHDQDPTEAVSHYRQAVFLWPTHAPAHFNLGTLLLRLHQDNRGREHILKACQADPHNEAFRRRADELLANSQRRKAESLSRGDSTPATEAEMPRNHAVFEGVRLRVDQLLDAALKGNTVNTVGTYRALPTNTAPEMAGRHATMAALAHLVAGRRRLRASLAAIPAGQARAIAISHIPVLADMIADLRKLEEESDTDHLAEAKRLTRRADSRHDEPKIATKLYRRALSEAPDHGPAFYGLFLLQRELGEREEAAQNLAMAVHFSPGNRVFRYYQQTWLQADPTIARFFPASVGSIDSRLSTGVHRPTAVFKTEQATLSGATASLDSPEEVRRAFDTMLANEEHERIVALTNTAWSRYSDDEAHGAVSTSLKIMAHVCALAHVDLALGLLQDATRLFAAAGPGARLRQIATEVCIDTIVGM